MSIDAGSISFARFRVSGGPKVIDAPLLDALRDDVLTAPAVGPPPEIQAGWVAGRHVLDAEFDADAVVFGDQLVLGLRVDTNRVPAELRRAYRAMAFAAAESGGGSGAESGSNGDGGARGAAARAETDERCQEALASGRFVRSRLVPIVWDVGRRLLLAPAFADTLQTVLRDQFRATFDASLDPLTSGAMASAWFSNTGRSRDFEDLKPSSYTSAPPAAESDANRPLDVPAVPWSYPDSAARDFLGNEFLIWLWHGVDTGTGMFETRRGDVGVTIDRALDMDCAWDVTGKQTLRATGPTRLPEARVALKHGKWPRKAGLVVAAGGDQWDLTLQGDRFLMTAVRGAKPETPPASRRERIEHRLSQLMALDETMVALYHAFLEQRGGPDWPRERTGIRQWAQASGRAPARTPAEAPLREPVREPVREPANGAVTSTAAPSGVPRPTEPS